IPRLKYGRQTFFPTWAKDFEFERSGAIFCLTAVEECSTRLFSQLDRFGLRLRRVPSPRPGYDAKAFRRRYAALSPRTRCERGLCSGPGVQSNIRGVDELQGLRWLSA